jgi:cytochrome P450
MATVFPTGSCPDGNAPILVRKGEDVFFSQYMNSRLKTIYGADADEFRPKRWETGELDAIGWAYFPFLGGLRRCLGEVCALMEIYYTVTRLQLAFPGTCLPDREQIEPVGRKSSSRRLCCRARMVAESLLTSSRIVSGYRQTKFAIIT